ncbi:hypothetical protein HanIR_Chr02g0058861 [Helianthus annuus]|nr:hypothetical protein HanIR_Chr02g0058861 [Helianthus annuus]
MVTYNYDAIVKVKHKGGMYKLRREDISIKWKRERGFGDETSFKGGRFVTSQNANFKIR